MLDKDLLQLLGPNKKYVVYTVFSMVLGLIANLGITSSICWGIAIAIKNEAAINFIYPVLIFLVAIIVRFATSYFTGNLKDRLGRNVKRDLRNKTYNKILELGVNSTDEMSMAGLTQVSVEGIEQLDMYYSSYLPQFFFSLIAPIILFIVTAIFDWKFALVLLCCVPLIPMSIVAVSKYAKNIFNKYWGIYTSMGDDFLDSVQGLKELKIFKADKEKHKKINKKSEEFRKITMKVLVMQLASVTIMDLVAFAGAGTGTAVAIVDMVNGNITPQVAIFLMLVAVEFFLPLRALGSAFHIAMNGASAGKKIINLLNAKGQTWGKEKVESTDLELKDVCFSYDSKRDVLNNVNMKFNSHGLTAIVGESGSGKSTIVNLLIGAIRQNKGDVLVGGKPLESLDRRNYYSNIASVSYNTYIFNDTVYNNFKLAKYDVTENEIWQALKKVNLDKFIEDNGGFNKIITEDANNISGGQRQRLALAINLIADKNIYIFDEATSNIDVESEAIIMDNVKEMSKTKNVIVISHRLENVVNADKIYYLENGVAKESGTHQELLLKKGSYAKLYNTQKELEEGYKTYLKKEIVNG